MRPNVPKPEEVKKFFKSATPDQKNQAVATLFDMAGDEAIPYPRNQYELIFHTLIFPPAELSMAYWMQEYRTHKFSTRLGQVEAIVGPLVSRAPKSFVNRFGHDSYYTVYTPILSKELYIKLYLEFRKNKK